jgi:hypothetical protein
LNPRRYGAPAIEHPLWILLACAAMTACTAVIDRASGRDEACKIIATGKPATAKILQLKDTGITINQDPVAEFVLEVYPANGRPFQARTQALISRLEIPLAQPGRIVPVRYDPKRATRVAIDLWDCEP